MLRLSSLSVGQRVYPRLFQIVMTIFTRRTALLSARSNELCLKISWKYGPLKNNLLMFSIRCDEKV